MNQTEGKRSIGLDMHPDVFAAAALSADPKRQHAEWVQDRLQTAGLEAWAKKQLRKEGVVVLEASGNRLGDVHRFATAKNLVGYLGLAPRKTQSGNDAKGRDQGMGKLGRGDVRGLLLQSAHNALIQRDSPRRKWGRKLLRLAAVLGKDAIKSLGFADRDAFVDAPIRV